MGDDRITPPDPIRRRVPTLKAGVPRPAKGSAPIPRGESADDPEAVRRIHELEAQNAELVGQLNTAARRQQESVSPAPPPRVERGSDPPASGKAGALVVTRYEVRIPTWFLGALISALGLGSWQAWEQIKATPARVDAAEKRLSALESRAHAIEDVNATQTAEQARQREYDRQIAPWIKLFAERLQIRARSPANAPPIGVVELHPERMPSDRVKGGPMWRAEEPLPQPP